MSKLQRTPGICRFQATELERILGPMSGHDYFARFGFCPRQIDAAAHADLAMVVVVPCHNEPGLIDTLESLWRCDRPRGAVEVIVVVNGSEASSAKAHAQNKRSLQECAQWSVSHRDPRLQFHALSFPDLPPRRAGVGLARKIGMDEALRRFSLVGRARSGIIANFDADSICDANYLVSVERHFEKLPGTPGCSVYFEHSLAGPYPARVYEGATLYELHLRYYVRALRGAKYPYAFHTIGSSMAVRADVYEEQGGMNTRQAGEDFYFLHKVIPLGGYSDLVETRVIPSPRASERVPFGTGRAIGDFLQGEPIRTYPLAAFTDLAQLVERVRNFPSGGSAAEFTEGLPETVRTFLDTQKFSQAWAVVQQHTSNEIAFRGRLFRWLDGFRVMKLIHHARDHFYGAANVRTETARLLGKIQRAGEAEPKSDARELLVAYRALDRQSEPGYRGEAFGLV